VRLFFDNKTVLLSFRLAAPKRGGLFSFTEIYSPYVIPHRPGPFPSDRSIASFELSAFPSAMMASVRDLLHQAAMTCDTWTSLIAVSLYEGDLHAFSPL